MGKTGIPSNSSFAHKQIRLLRTKVSEAIKLRDPRFAKTISNWMLWTDQIFMLYLVGFARKADLLSDIKGE